LIGKLLSCQDKVDHFSLKLFYNEEWVCLMGIDDHVILPVENGEYKVVQIEFDGKPYLRFSDTPPFVALHGFLLQSFLDERNVHYATIVDIGHDGQSIQIPAPHGEQYRLVGAGIALVNLEHEVIKFHGKSVGYNIGIDFQQLEVFKQFLPDWRFIDYDK